jgi:hypothetical protein
MARGKINQVLIKGLFLTLNAHHVKALQRFGQLSLFAKVWFLCKMKSFKANSRKERSNFWILSNPIYWNQLQ